MLAQFTQWLVGLVKSFFSGLWAFVIDAFIGLVELFVGAIVGLLSLIPVPQFLSDGLQRVYSDLDPGIIYLLSASGLPAALAILGLAYVFRLGRKVATLFQW